MVERRKIHIVNKNGEATYNRLWDEGGNVMPFDSGHGFVSREWAERNGFVCDGWVPEDEWTPGPGAAVK